MYIFVWLATMSIFSLKNFLEHCKYFFGIIHYLLFIIFFFLLVICVFLEKLFYFYFLFYFLFWIIVVASVKYIICCQYSVNLYTIDVASSYFQNDINLLFIFFFFFYIFIPVGVCFICKNERNIQCMGINFFIYF